MTTVPTTNEIVAGDGTDISKVTRLVPGRGERRCEQWALSDSGGWYDLRVTVDVDATFARHTAGHVEIGQDNISQPLIGGIV